MSCRRPSGVEIVVAINKIDKDGANPERVKQELTEYELVPTAWGGSTEFVEVSAKTGEGIEDLLETILLTADIMELKANPNRKARGLVLEAKLDKGRGPVANVLVQKGTLHIGDFISAGASSGKVRAMIDDKGRRVKVALPSHPVEILGLSDVPSAGEVFLAHDDLQTAKSYAGTYKVQRKEELIEETRMRMNLDDLFSQMKEGNLKEFNLILKADVQGSVEALRQSLLKLSNEEVIVKVIHAAVGNITESDVSLASASNAVIIGFNVRPDMMAKSMADQEGVDIRLYKVIYQAIDAIELALKGMLAPVYEERVIGHAQVRMLFKASHVGNIAGSMVTDGVIRRGCKVRIRRGDEQIYEGSLASLKRFKDDAKEVREGFECGLVFDGFVRKNSVKNRKINDEVRRVLAQIISGGIKDPRISPMTSVLVAEVAPDLKTCKVWVSVYGDEQKKKDTMAGLASAAGFIRGELARRVNLRNTPQLQFILDDSIAYGVEMSRRIDEVIAADHRVEEMREQEDAE